MKATLPSDEPPSKNWLLMYPNTPASQLIPNLSHNYRQRHRNEAGGSSSSAASRNLATISDRQFIAIVSSIIRRARENPGLYSARQLLDEETRALATSVLEYNESTGGATGEALQQYVTGEMVRIVGDILDDIFRSWRRQPEATGGGAGEEEEEADYSGPEDPDNKDDKDDDDMEDDVE